MQLNVENSEAIRELVLSGKEETLQGISWNSETLAGAMNLACIEKEFLSTLAVKHLFFRLLNGWQDLILFQTARRAMNYRGLWSVESSMKAKPQRWEILPVPLQEQVNDLVWFDLQRRFVASLQANQFGEKLSKALAGALHEMADNALRHSGPSIQTPSWGAVGYSLAQGQMTFCIADVGRGVMESLRANPANSGLRTDQEALQAAVIGHATSDARKESGDGFEHVHRALSDLNGRLRFRSGTSVLVLDGRQHNRLITPTSGMLPVAGFQVVVHCVLDGFASDSEL